MKDIKDTSEVTALLVDHGLFVALENKKFWICRLQGKVSCPYLKENEFVLFA